MKVFCRSSEDRKALNAILGGLDLGTKKAVVVGIQEIQYFLRLGDLDYIRDTWAFCKEELSSADARKLRRIIF